MADDPLIHPGDEQRDEPIERRDDADGERELRVDRQQELPGGAEGGDESRSAHMLVDHPGQTEPLGDTDQHSDPSSLPPHRERANAERAERDRRGTS